MKKNEETGPAAAAAVQAPNPDWGIFQRLAWIQARLVSPKERRNAAVPELEYRNIEDICNAAGPLLEESALILTFSEEVKEIGGARYVVSTAKVTDVGGKSVSCVAYAREDEYLPDMCAAQITGSCTSYARKYAAAGLFAIGSGRHLAAGKDIDSLDPVAAATMRKKAAAGEVPDVPSPVRNPYATDLPILMPGFGGWKEEVLRIKEWNGTRDAYLKDLASRWTFNEDTQVILFSYRAEPFSGE